MSAQIPVVVTDEDIVRIGERNPDWCVERIAGELVMTPPSGFMSDARAARAVQLLSNWAENFGGMVAASQGGAKPANGDLVAPDASWVSADRWNALSPQAREGFLPFAPDVVVEVLSKSDKLERITAKCERWYDGGAGYVFLIDPYAKTIATWGKPPAAGFPDFAPILEM